MNTKKWKATVFYLLFATFGMAVFTGCGTDAGALMMLSNSRSQAAVSVSKSQPLSSVFIMNWSPQLHDMQRAADRNRQQQTAQRQQEAQNRFSVGLLLAIIGFSVLLYFIISSAIKSANKDKDK